MTTELSPLGRSGSPDPDPTSPLAGGVVGEVAALAPDTFVVPGWRPVAGTGLGLQAGTLVVRGQATAVVDTGLAGLAPDWLNAVLCVVDPAEVRWVVLTDDGPAHTGGLESLLTICPDATVVRLDGRQGLLDLGDRTVHLVTDGAGHPAVAVPDRAVVWADLLSGAFARPTHDITSASDEDLLAALAHRTRHPTPARVAALAALSPRVLASPTGPAARGRSVARALDLLATARDGHPPATPSVDDLRQGLDEVVLPEQPDGDR
jgi:hypothetical protein